MTLPWDSARRPNGTRTLAAQVRDAANNGGQDTRAMNVQNAGAGPTAAFTSPAAGATVSGTVSVGLAACGGTTPYTYRLTVDGAQVFTTSAGASATYTWNTTAVANGSHTLGLTVTDAAGASATATRTVTVQNTVGRRRWAPRSPRPPRERPSAAPSPSAWPRAAAPRPTPIA